MVHLSMYQSCIPDILKVVLLLLGSLLSSLRILFQLNHVMLNEHSLPNFSLLWISGILGRLFREFRQPGHILCCMQCSCFRSQRWNIHQQDQEIFFNSKFIFFKIKQATSHYDIERKISRIKKKSPISKISTNSSLEFPNG